VEQKQGFLPASGFLAPKVVAAVKHIVEVYAKNARKHERMGEWIERIGWERFFDKCEIPFTQHLIDDYRLAYDTYRTSTQFKFFQDLGQG
jgi:sulfite reductase beta subunit